MIIIIIILNACNIIERYAGKYIQESISRVLWSIVIENCQKHDFS